MQWRPEPNLTKKDGAFWIASSKGEKGYDLRSRREREGGSPLTVSLTATKTFLCLS